MKKEQKQEYRNRILDIVLLYDRICFSDFLDTDIDDICCEFFKSNLKSV